MDNKIIAYEVGWNNLDDWSKADQELPPIWLIFLGCLRMKELPTISFDEIFVCFFYSRKNMDLGMVWGDLVMLMTEWKGSVFRESISKDRQPHDWNMIFNEMTSYLDLPKFVKLVPAHCHRKKAKPKGKHSTFLEDPNMFIRVIGPRRKKGSLNLICCFLFFSVNLLTLQVVLLVAQSSVSLLRSLVVIPGTEWCSKQSLGHLPLKHDYTSPSKFGLNQKPCSQ